MLVGIIIYMINKHRKGISKEKELCEILKKLGYAPIRMNWAKFGAKDFWGIFDILAPHDQKTALFIQVKNHKTFGPSQLQQEKEKLETFKMKAVNMGVKMMLAIRKPPGWTGRGKNKIFEKGDWKFQIYHPEYKIWKELLREDL